MLFRSSLAVITLSLFVSLAPARAQNEAAPGEDTDYSIEDTSNQNVDTMAEEQAQTELAAKRIKAFKTIKLATGMGPLFNRPSMPSTRFLADFVGRDPNLMANIDLSQQAALARANAFTQIQADMRLQKPKSEQYLKLGNTLARQYEEQALYLEQLRGFGLSDKNNPDLNHAIKVTRSNLIAQLDQLVAQFPNSEFRAHWKATALISRLKIGDPSVLGDIKKFTTPARTADAQRVLQVAIAMDAAAGRSRSAYGSVAYALRMNMDPVTRSVFKLFLADTLTSNGPSLKALGMYDEASKDGLTLRYPDGSLSPMTQRAGARMIADAIRLDNANVNKDVVSSLQASGMQSAALYYMETIALHNVRAQHRRAMSQYADILPMVEQTPDVSLQIEVRILDIALAANDSGAIENQWQRISRIPGGMAVPGMDTRIIATQQLAWNAVVKSPSVDTVDRIVRQHDFFVSLNPTYANNEDWALKIVKALDAGRRHAEVASRADALAAKSRNRNMVLTCSRYAARAREKILKIFEEPLFIENKPLSEAQTQGPAYIANLDKIASFVNGKEAQTVTYQAGYVVYLMHDVINGRSRLEAAMNKFPRSSYAPKSASFLLGLAIRSKDYAYVERAARLCERNRISPADTQHKNLRNIIEIAVYAQAEGLAVANQNEAAAIKYVAFQKEFPRSKNADNALHKAAQNYLEAKKTNDGLNQMEALLKFYPKSNYAFNTRWQAAELSKSTNQFQRAANHYEAFAKTYDGEGRKRKAWLTAAEMQKQAGRYASSVSDYDTYLKTTGSQAEKIRTAREMATLQMQYGRFTEAIAALERVRLFSKNVDDTIWVKSNIADIYSKQGQTAKSRNYLNQVIALKPASQDGFKLIARAKFSLAKMEAADLRSENPINQKSLLAALKRYVSHYDRVKALYIAPCEVPGVDVCAVGYYEAAKLAEEIAGKIIEIQPPTTLNRNEVEPLKSFITNQSNRIAADNKSLAEQAVQAIPSSGTDADTAERIRSYANVQNGGETGAGLPPQ